MERETEQISRMEVQNSLPELDKEIRHVIYGYDENNNDSRTNKCTKKWIFESVCAFCAQS